MTSYMKTRKLFLYKLSDNQLIVSCSQFCPSYRGYDMKA